MLTRGASRYLAFHDVDPHAYFGLVRGCRLAWQPDRTYETNGTTYHAVFIGGCSGSVFAVDGTRLFGPAPRDLDQFFVEPLRTGHDDLIVDTRILICEERAPTAGTTFVPAACHRTLAD